MLAALEAAKQLAARPTAPELIKAAAAAAAVAASSTVTSSVALAAAMRLTAPRPSDDDYLADTWVSKEESKPKSKKRGLASTSRPLPTATPAALAPSAPSADEILANDGSFLERAKRQLTDGASKGNSSAAAQAVAAQAAQAAHAAQAAAAREAQEQAYAYEMARQQAAAAALAQQQEYEAAMAAQRKQQEEYYYAFYLAQATEAAERAALAEGDDAAAPLVGAAPAPAPPPAPGLAPVATAPVSAAAAAVAVAPGTSMDADAASQQALQAAAWQQYYAGIGMESQGYYGAYAQQAYAASSYPHIPPVQLAPVPAPAPPGADDSEGPSRESVASALASAYYSGLGAP